MPFLLAALRQTAQPSPEKFLDAHPGCHVQYFDDTGARDPAKALSARTFVPAVARQKQSDRCAVCFSLQAFGASRTREGLLCFRHLGVDVDLVATTERGTIAPEEIDRRKEEYLARRLLPFPLKPHWLVETRHGFHAVWRVRGLRKEDDVAEALAVNRRLVAALGGDPNAVLLTQVFRVPGTFQFKDPRQPFLCRLLVDNTAEVAPFELHAVRAAVEAWEAFSGVGREAGEGAGSGRHGADDNQSPRWLDGLNGVPEGRRNATAASVVGAILGRLPESLWETAGWGGLREWNRRNPVPLPEPELRGVFLNIARRERTKVRGEGRGAAGEAHASITAQVDVRIEDGQAKQTHRVGTAPAPPRPGAPTPPPAVP